MKVFISFFNEIEYLPRCIESIKTYIPNVDIIAIDGVFYGYGDYREFYSTDGSSEYLWEQNIPVIDRKTPWLTEAHKRNMFFKFLKEGEKWIYMDADEQVNYYNEDLFDKDNGLVRLKHYDNKFLVKRGFINISNIEFITHCHLVNTQTKIITSLHFHHDNDREVFLELETIREKEREEMVRFKQKQLRKDNLIVKEYKKGGYRT